MIRRHEEQIMNRFDSIYANGMAVFTRDELLLWYGLTKITKTIYADLCARWERTLEDYLGEDVANNLIKKNEEEILVIVKGDHFMMIRESLCSKLSEF
ncbi:MAG: hypothetical protein ABL933_02680 [Methyloglobulus sp.]|nr:hypothetical protein [Methyloglobulus sp.]